MTASYKINPKISHKIISAENDIIEGKTLKINLKDLWMLKDLKWYLENKSRALFNEKKYEN